MKITIDIHDKDARQKIDNGPDSVREAMRGAMEDATTYALALIKRYPVPPGSSSYTRTHTLEKSWSRTVRGSGARITGQVGSNGNMAPYNRYVQDRERQARIHRGRWLTIQQLAENEEPRIQRMFADRIRAAGY